MDSLATKFQQRIGYSGDVSIVLKQVCRDYDVGVYKSHKLITTGYEDFNLILQTDEGRFLVKIFALFRDLAECERYVNVMLRVIAAKITHPNIYESVQGYLYQGQVNGASIQLCVMQYVQGQTYFELGTTPTLGEAKQIVKEIVKINSMDYKPLFVYDSWAIPNLLTKFNKVKSYLNSENRELVQPIIEQFKNFDFTKLPHCFVHGDVITTNVLKGKDSAIYILDFACSNYYPRIQELAVFVGLSLFDPKNPQSFSQYYKIVLEEYQKNIKLTSAELEALPFYIKLAHTMEFLGATLDWKLHFNSSPENMSALKVGLAGLKYMSKNPL